MRSGVEPDPVRFIVAGTHEIARWHMLQSRGSAAVVAVATWGKIPGRW